MNIKIISAFFASVLMSGCSMTSDMAVPPLDVGHSVQSPSSGWAPYQPSQQLQPELQPTPSKAWRGNTAWGYPPAPATAVRSTPAAEAPIDDSMIAKPVPDTATVEAPSSEADVERAPLQTVQSDASLTQDAAPNSWMNVSSSRSLWVDRHVPATMREAFGTAASQAAVEGTATVVDPDSGNHYSMSRVWKVGKCSGIDVSMLSPGGKLPVISRGSTEVCS